MGKCDKCGQNVPRNNDASLLAVYSGEIQAWQLIGISPRHLLPTDTCEGSPSRAQYLEGQPRDNRGYPYIPEMEDKIRKAFVEIQKL